MDVDDLVRHRVVDILVVALIIVTVLNVLVVCNHHRECLVIGDADDVKVFRPTQVQRWTRRASDHKVYCAPPIDLMVPPSHVMMHINVDI